MSSGVFIVVSAVGFFLITGAAREWSSNSMPTIAPELVLKTKILAMLPEKSTSPAAEGGESEVRCTSTPRKMGAICRRSHTIDVLPCFCFRQRKLVEAHRGKTHVIGRRERLPGFNGPDHLVIGHRATLIQGLAVANKIAGRPTPQMTCSCRLPEWGTHGALYRNLPAPGPFSLGS